jgi:hypothetical protein
MDITVAAVPVDGATVVTLRGERLPHSNRYQLTRLGRRVAVMFTKAYGHRAPRMGPRLCAR